MKRFYPIILVVLMALLCLQFQSYRDLEKQIMWDSFGYYLYLPSVLIHQDPGMEGEWLDEVYDTYQPSATRYQLIALEDGKQMTKYSAGLAVAMLPAFIIAHEVAILTDYPADGFSAPYSVIVTAWCQLLMLMGVLLFYRFLKTRFDEHISFLTTLGVIIGSNFILSTIYSPLMTHGLLFFGYAALLLFTERWYRLGGRKNLWLLALVFGWMCLSRPTEIIACLIPLFWGGNPFNEGGFIHKLKANTSWKEIGVALGIVVLCASVQIAYWYAVSGKLFYYSYDNAGEGLDFSHPYIFESLFSFRKGWWLYSPLCLIAFIGLFFAEKGNRFKWGLIGFVLLNIYIVSSWTTWWYAASFGQRPYVQSYPVLFIGLAILIQRFKQWRVAGIAIVGAFSFLSLFQSWQMLNGILPDDRITKKYYTEHFLATNKKEGSDRWLLVERGASGEANWQYKEDYQAVFDTTISLGAIAKDQEFPWSWSPLPNALYDADHAWIQVEVEASGLEGQMLQTFMATHKGKAYNWRSNPIQDEATFQYLSPHFRSEEDPLSIQIWNPYGAKLDAIDIRIQLYTRNDKGFY